LLIMSLLIMSVLIVKLLITLYNIISDITYN
jgi:hypothetical protein